MRTKEKNLKFFFFMSDQTYSSASLSHLKTVFLDLGKTKFKTHIWQFVQWYYNMKPGVNLIPTEQKCVFP